MWDRCGGCHVGSVWGLPIGTCVGVAMKDLYGGCHVGSVWGLPCRICVGVTM